MDPVGPHGVGYPGHHPHRLGVGYPGYPRELAVGEEEAPGAKVVVNPENLPPSEGGMGRKEVEEVGVEGEEIPRVLHHRLLLPYFLLFHAPHHEVVYRGVEGVHHPLHSLHPPVNPHHNLCNTLTRSS